MISRTSRLQKSKVLKDDEYYTLFDDIADEMFRYLPQMEGMRILCPCDWDESYDEEIVYKEEGYVIGRPLLVQGGTADSPVCHTSEKIEKDMDLVSNQFVYYLLNQAEEFGIKSVSVSGYNPSVKRGIRFQDIDYSLYDCIVTNPPFSQFAEFIDLLIKSKVKFLVIGPQDALTLKPIIQHFQNNEIKIGYNYHLSGFKRPNGTTISKQDNVSRSCMWYTNMDIELKQKKIVLKESYEETPEKYPKYVNYDAIHVPKTSDIPCDYFGEMGVPITFMHKYNPSQFELIGSSIQLAKPISEFVEEDASFSKGGPRFYLKIGDKTYKRLFDRIVIKRRR